MYNVCEDCDGPKQNATYVGKYTQTHLESEGGVDEIKKKIKKKTNFFFLNSR